ncbi:MAG TPA: VanZ family protein [Thermoanaerobaculia bacterium]|nr:VanZ family protein [Thermoanaerobaculia bacterium]HUM31262.1 VanZ family protein [Thermoanaerobaculia bacterium]HXK69611.1 VanZ family protein [Thermoanaerobaculia bacterium]
MADVPSSSEVIPSWRPFLATVYSLAVLGLSLWPSPRLPAGFSHGDLVAHTILYFFLALIWLKVPIHWTIVLPGAITFGLIMELIQLIIPGRTMTVSDLVANGIGAITAAVLLRLWPKSW